MLQILCVAEKPSVARQLAGCCAEFSQSVLEQRSYSKYNPVKLCKATEVNTATFGARQADVFVTSVSGHFLSYELEDEAANKNWYARDPGTVLTAPIIKRLLPQSMDIMRNLVHYAKLVNCLVLWSDCDSEGENIGACVKEVCCKASARLTVHRAQFCATTKADLKRAFFALRQLDERLAVSVDVRQELDFRSGVCFTRLLTINLRAALQGAAKFLSYGPCQFPTLALIVHQHLKVLRFREQFFYTLELAPGFADAAEPLWMHHVSPLRKCFDKVFAYHRYARLLEQQRCVVRERAVRLVKCKPPLPLTTLSMCVKAAKFLRLSSNECMRLAENLYNRGIISYPRTETDAFADAQYLDEKLKNLWDHPEFGQLARGICAKERNSVLGGGRSDNAHLPIHPVRSVSDLAGKERELYRLICLSFLAACDEDAVLEETALAIELDGELFRSSGSVVKVSSFLEYYREFHPVTINKRLPQSVLNLQSGLALPVAGLKLVEGVTTQPKSLDEAGLLVLLDRYGIGTDATMHEHIKNVIVRNYVEKKSNGQLVPTKLGFAISLVFSRHFPDLISVSIRSKLEAQVKAIARAEVEPAHAIVQYKRFFQQAYAKMVQDMPLLKQEISTLLSISCNP